MQYLKVSFVADFIEAAEVFRGMGIKVEQENGAVIFSALMSYDPHARGQLKIGASLDMWATDFMPSFWAATEQYLPIGHHSRIFPDVSAGPRGNGVKMTTFACEISDRNPVTQARINTYHLHPQIQYLLVIRIGSYTDGNPASLVSLTAELYDIPNRSLVGGVIDLLQCTAANPTVITLPRARLFQGFPIPPNALTDWQINLFHVKYAILTGIEDL